MGFRPSVYGTTRRLNAIKITGRDMVATACSILEAAEHTGKPLEEVDTSS